MLCDQIQGRAEDRKVGHDSGCRGQKTHVNSLRAMFLCVELKIGFSLQGPFPSQPDGQTCAHTGMLTKVSTETDTPRSIHIHTDTVIQTH